MNSLTLSSTEQQYQKQCRSAAYMIVAALVAEGLISLESHTYAEDHDWAVRVVYSLLVNRQLHNVVDHAGLPFQVLKLRA